jgi:hypothetical protein
LKKEFQLFDTNNDGFIDKKELKVILQKILPKFQLPDDEIQQMISNVDKNNDGKIDYNGNEFFLLIILFFLSDRIYGINLSTITTIIIILHGISFLFINSNNHFLQRSS